MTALIKMRWVRTRPVRNYWFTTQWELFGKVYVGGGTCTGSPCDFARRSAWGVVFGSRSRITCTHRLELVSVRAPKPSSIAA